MLPMQRHKHTILTLLNKMVTLLLFSYFSFQKKILPLPRAIRAEDMNQQANITSLPINKLEEVYHLLDPPIPEVCFISKDFYDSLF